jgi:cytochrome c peroxidase
LIRARLAFAPLLLALSAALPAAAAGPEAWTWSLPPGFPLPLVPADNPMSTDKVDLGRRLFFEPRLAEAGQLACASCHQPALAYTDGRALPRGARGDWLTRNAPSLANLVYAPALGWEDRGVDSLEQQMLTPLLGTHPVEMGMAGREAEVLALLSADSTYAADFAKVFGTDAPAISIAHLVQSIAAFERTLISGRSAFDRYVFEDDRSGMSAAARRGMQLFYGPRAGCSRCHGGITFAGEVRAVGHDGARATYADTGVDAQERGPFKVPTLRNVALTAPYLHDGSLPTLEAVLEFYDRGGHQRRMQPLGLKAREKQDLAAFLASLTDAQFVTAAPP